MKALSLHQPSHCLRQRAVLVASCMLLLGCQKEPPVNDRAFPDRIVFGTFLLPLNCSGAETCVEIFEMKSGSLREDVLDDIPLADMAYAGDFTAGLSMAKYQDIQEIFMDNIPPELLSTASGEIGQIPEWTTHFYFEYHSGDFHGHWIIDGSFSSPMPAAIQNFINIIANASAIASN